MERQNSKSNSRPISRGPSSSNSFGVHVPESFSHNVIRPISAQISQTNKYNSLN
jgi:hypothetical protein